MEENKNINVVETAQNEPKKLSYEELEKIALNLQEQCQKLYAQNQEMQVGMMFKRLDYLFKVLKEMPKDFHQANSSLEKSFCLICKLHEDPSSLKDSLEYSILGGFTS